jgi:RNA polymerase sigma-70 factor (ECF subfamily)
MSDTATDGRSSADASRDNDLIARIRRDDLEAFEELVRTYANMLADVVFTIVRADALPEEVVQDIFLRIWNTRERLDIRGSVQAYLIRAARNLAFRTARRERSQRHIVDELRRSQPSGGPQTTNLGEHKIEESELEKATRRAIDELPARMREIFLLHLDHELRAPEIAAILGITPATVHNQVYRATKHLAGRLKDWL